MEGHGDDRLGVHMPDCAGVIAQLPFGSYDLVKDEPPNFV